MIQEPVNIVCFYWQGTDRPGWMSSALGLDYILKLYQGFKKHTMVPFKFHCITTFTEFKLLSVTDGIIFHEMNAPSYKGCLPKYSMFNPEFGFTGRVFACDLDVVVTGNMDEILSYNGPFATRSTFRGKKESGGDMIAFEGGTFQWIWDQFKEDPKKVEEFTGGRERWVYRYHPNMLDSLEFLQDLYPDQIFSYKNHCNRNRGLPDNARLVSCHGNPRPHEIRDQWVKDHWGEYGHIYNR